MIYEKVVAEVGSRERCDMRMAGVCLYPTTYIPAGVTFVLRIDEENDDVIDAQACLSCAQYHHWI